MWKLRFTRRRHQGICKDIGGGAIIFSGKVYPQPLAPRKIEDRRQSIKQLIMGCYEWVWLLSHWSKGLHPNRILDRHPGPLLNVLDLVFTVGEKCGPGELHLPLGSNELCWGKEPLLVAFRVAHFERTTAEAHRKRHNNGSHQLGAIEPARRRRSLWLGMCACKYNLKRIPHDE